MSGYDLRKFFATTAMGSFSDSPGAIYPALRRLEASGWVRSQVQESDSLRKRRLFRITPEGLGAFKTWLGKPVLRDDVVRRIGDLMLRFAFMEQALGTEHAARFLGELAREIGDYIPTLQQYLEAHAHEMPLSGRLALECGIQEYETRLRWARTSIALYEQRERDRA